MAGSIVFELPAILVSLFFDFALTWLKIVPYIAILEYDEYYLTDE